MHCIKKKANSRETYCLQGDWSYSFVLTRASVVDNKTVYHADDICDGLSTVLLFGCELNI